MLKIKKFDPTKTYMFVDGTIADADALRKANPAIDMFPHVLELNGNVVQAVMSLSALQNIYNIDETLTEDEAISAIGTIINTPIEEVISPEERTASAMEFSNLMLLEDVVIDTSNKSLVIEGEPIVDDPVTKLIRRNYDRGLWSAPMLEKAVSKGVISHTAKEDIKKIKNVKTK